MKPEERVRWSAEMYRVECLHEGEWQKADEVSIAGAITEAVTAERERVLLEVSKVRQRIFGQGNRPQVVDAYCAACDLIRDAVRLTP